MSNPNTLPETVELPLLPLRDVVVFPHMVIPLFVGRPKSIKALEMAMEGGKNILLVAQKSAAKDEPEPEDLYRIGCMANILQMLKLPDGTVKVLVEGTQRARVESIEVQSSMFIATATPLPQPGIEDHEIEAMRRAVVAQFDQFVKLNKKIPPEVLSSIAGIEDAGRLADTIAAHLPLKLEQKQEVLEMESIRDRIDRLLSQLESEIDILQVEKRIRGRVKRQMEKSQREYYLNEQVKAIQKELGEGEEGADLDELDKKIKAAGMSKEGLAKAQSELKKLRLMSPMSAEATVVRNFIETLVGLPWRKKTRISKDLREASKILDADHFGLDKVKERIIEHLAVLKLRGDMKSPIICLYDPPGVGKTSLGKSVAEALNRKYIRISLGGLHDEAEIRGHRRTYIGAMPGRIIQGLIKAKSSNPVFVLDEIDKIGNDFKGDPASALLEVLDPEQNNAFHDNYIDIDYDLSKILFIATANNLNTISQPLLDRMELIDISGYIIEEKVEIGRRHLVPKQLENHGLKEGDVIIPKKVMAAIVDQYTRESGVRELDKKIARIMRKVARLKASGKEYNPTLSIDDLHEYLGAQEYNRDKYENNDYAGVVTGLAWTAVGGEILFVESSLSKSKGEKLTLTGNLGDVMKESAVIALQYIKSHASLLGIDEDIFDKWAVHIHVPEGAIPKDGPSAGITMVTSLASTFTQRKVKDHLAMTGEITLRGKVLPVGGIKEKILAAKRAGIREIILSEENRKDIEEIKESYLKGLTFHYVKNITDVLKIALTDEKVKNAIDIK